MNDLLLQIGQNAQIKKLVSSVGIPVPQKLDRSDHPWEEHPLSGKNMVVAGTGELSDVIASTILSAGANVYVIGGNPDPYVREGANHARAVHPLEPNAPTPTAYGYIFDATDLKHPQFLENLYAFFHARMRGLSTCGRIVVLARPVQDQENAAAAATSRAIEGFVRSVAKEIGRKGATANLIYVSSGTEDRMPYLLRFLLSSRSAYISGQPFSLTKKVKLPSDIPIVQPLAGKVALVTGAARGIGAAIVERFAQEGAHVIGLDRPGDEQPLSAVIQKVKGEVLLQDISETQAADKIAEFLKSKPNGIDIVVHNAGVTRDRTLANMDAQLWDQAIGINLNAVINITERLLADNLIHNNGRLVCLSSVAGISGNFGQTNYSASKAGIIGFVEHLAPKLAKKGMTINAVAPGFIETRLTAAIPMVTREVGRRLCNLSQGGLPLDIAEVITFLASPGAAGLTGSVIRVCGGSLLGA